ncbi:MAG: hypothetical protein B7Y62_03530 [Sphingomonadales bacterium 35-56-22]|uniref:hypothetical protein n=1 Tax=Sphingorhabdus sp. TaxID=1902408 RepID=UPI000BDCB703|nr:hypothetical protein [Sphingorhabdus sp.]OYY16217.1 MAG: hypothetical protein B7Y62_03530 [Sphingomonadales bacterium 35-56-22]OYY98568.1 MAG: hypothetical protein B7Y38_01525 [Sphingomonadales bacterium 28-56-43]OYZ61936.1 MAG: hypothetical protein B7Y10_00740 [Sphingomonadales bacterium 24-56-14]OZA84026.1 MAG: hypothetical protein B7X66_02665 [Sphingomonadales bacterium 39-57-19]HQS11683.1 hypothetical protein [Sphingorhabdus sp.]
MGEPKPIASLSGILLARKGLARPAIRRPTMLSSNGNAAMSQDDLGWNDMGYDVDPDPTTPMDYEHGFQGVNPLAAAVPEVKHQQDRLADALFADLEPQAGADSFVDEPESVADAPTLVTVTPEPVTPLISRRGSTDAPRSRARSKPGLKAKAAFTLRLDSERHLKLRLACAVRHQSAQQLVTDALDALLESMPEIGDLASHVPAKKH